MNGQFGGARASGWAHARGLAGIQRAVAPGGPPDDSELENAARRPAGVQLARRYQQSCSGWQVRAGERSEPGWHHDRDARGGPGGRNRDVTVTVPPRSVCSSHQHGGAPRM